MIKAKYLNHLLASDKFEEFVNPVQEQLVVEFESADQKKSFDGDTASSLTLDDIAKIPYNELKEILKANGIPSFGVKKDELARRLLEFNLRGRQNIPYEQR